MAYSTRVGNIQIQGGWANKDTVDLRITFTPAFGGVPAVIVTSEWQTAGVSYVDTIYNVSRFGFNVHSANRAPNYYVNWMAIGPVPGVAALSSEMEDAVSAFKKLDRSKDGYEPKESVEAGSAVGQAKHSESDQT